MSKQAGDSPATRPVREERQPASDSIDEVAPGILRLQLPISMPGLGHVNCYALEDSRGVALIDPGLPGRKTWQLLNQRLTQAGLPAKRVHTVLITHSHPDHFGQAQTLRAKFGAEIVTHSNFRTIFDPDHENDDTDPEASFDPDPDPGLCSVGSDSCNHDPAEQPLRKASVNGATPNDSIFNAEVPWGGKPFELPMRRKAAYFMARRFGGKFWSLPKPTQRVEDSQVLTFGGQEWVAVHTPGHTADHLCLWNPANGVMISGDHILPTITPHISGMSTTVDPLANFFDSLDRMKTFQNVNMVLPAHGQPFRDLVGRSDSIKVHHHERLKTLQESGNELGWGTVTQYMEKLFKQRSWGSMAESETYAHLEHMRIEGKAAVNSEGSELRYSMLD